MSVTVIVQLNEIPVPLELDEDALAAIATALDRNNAHERTWLNADSAAAYLDVSVERVRKLVARRDLPFHQEAPGCRVFFNRHDLDAWMGQQRHAARTTG